MEIPKGVTEFRATVTTSDGSSGLTVKAAEAGKQLHVVDLIISADTASSYQVEDEDNTAVMEQLHMPANSVFAKTFEIPLVLESGKALQVTAGASGELTVTAHGYAL